jgi:hypothetical protein
VAIGSGVNVASPGGSCQLAIGFASGQTWLTGTSTKAIKPGAGIIDCAGSCGTAGQVLMSNGSNAICWGTVSGGSGIPCSIITAKGTLVTGTAANTPSALGVGTDGQILYACSTSVTGLCWAAAPSGGSGTVTSVCAGTGLCGGDITTSGTVSLDTACVIQPSALTAKGDLISASAASTPTALSVGTNGQVLSACSACASGLVWATPQTSPYITYTTSAVSYTTGTPLLVAKWPGWALQGTITLDLAGYGGVQQLWDIYLTGDPTNYNSGWYQTASWPASSSDPISQGTWSVDFPVYPDPDANTWMIYFNPSQDSLNPSTFTFFYRMIAGPSPTFQI